MLLSDRGINTTLSILAHKICECGTKKVITKESFLGQIEIHAKDAASLEKD